MTKQQKKQLESLSLHLAMGNIEAVARGLSAMIRSAMTSKQRAGLMDEAHKLGVIGHPEFII